MKDQHFLNNCEKLAINKLKTGLITLFGHLYKTINNSIASVNISMSDIFDFSTNVIILNEQFINKVVFTCNELNNYIIDTENPFYVHIFLNNTNLLYLTHDTFSNEDINFNKNFKP